MSQFAKIVMRKAGGGYSGTFNQAVLSPEEMDIRVKIFAQFVKNLVGFRQGKQSSCRGAWTAKEYGNVRMMLREVPKGKAFEMWVLRMSHRLMSLDDTDLFQGTLSRCVRLPCR